MDERRESCCQFDEEGKGRVKVYIDEQAAQNWLVEYGIKGEVLLLSTLNFGVRVNV